MNNALLYFTTTFLWGTTWLAIKFQLGTVPPTWSIVYRFALAAALLLLYCMIKKHPLRFSLKQHVAMAVQAAFLFCGNYILFYLGSEYLSSGLVALIFAGIIIFNILLGRIFLGILIERRVLVGALIGLLGLGTVLWSELALPSSHSMLHALLGISLCIAATIFASFGNIMSTFNQKYALPVLQSNALGMAYGALFTLFIALLLGQAPTFQWDARYILSLLYLSLLGSVAAFGCYLTLIGRIGPARASYSFVLIPIIALLISTSVENFHWHAGAFIGIALILSGNILILRSVDSSRFLFKNKANCKPSSGMSKSYLSREASNLMPYLDKKDELPTDPKK